MDMDEMRSDEIFEAIKRREHSVFKHLFETYFKKMTLFAEYFLLDRDEAEDIAQEIFVDLWNNAPMLSGISNLKSYLFVQVRNRCFNRLKHLHVEDNYKQWLAEVEVDPELLQRVYEVIEELPEQARLVFKRCVLEGKKYKDVAEEMGVSVNTINTQMTRSYKYIRKRMGVSFLVILAII